MQFVKDYTNIFLYFQMFRYFSLCLDAQIDSAKKDGRYVCEIKLSDSELFRPFVIVMGKYENIDIFFDK